MLNTKELNYLQNRDFLETKVIIQEKITKLLGNTQKALKGLLKAIDFVFPPQTDFQAGKISKGERYQNLPYWVLDYPKLLSKEDVFALRTMVWWGNEITCTLHLQGRSWEKYRASLIANLKQVKEPNLLVCLDTHPWEYALTPNNYQPLEKIGAKEKQWEIFHEKDFFKMTKSLELAQHTQLPTFACTCFELYLNLLTEKIT